MSHESVVLNHAMRVAAEAAMRHHCAFRGWTLHALNLRTNHVHAVVSAGEVPAAAVAGQLKAWATRMLREQRLASPDARIWARHSSTRMVWTEQDLVEAVDYVSFRQGAPLT